MLASQLEEDFPEENRGAKSEARRPQQPGDGAAAGPVLHYLPGCVVKVICDSPARRAASMTRMTAWCVAGAAALSTTLRSFRGAAARLSSSATWSTPAAATGW